VKRIFMFDIDGTLTPHRQPMTKSMVMFFSNFCKENKVFLVTGSDWEKVKEQVPSEVLALTQGIYTCSGNALYGSDGTLLREREYQMNPHLERLLSSLLESSPYHVKTGRHIENRPGMVNFSIVGRACTLEQREEYSQWDSTYRERRLLRDKIMSSFAGLDVALGGQISLDIYPTGWNKAQAYNEVKDKNPDHSIVFYGDRLEHGGNDYPIYEAMCRSNLAYEEVADFAYEVKDYQETITALREF
tara:strand:+ start:980 stop:1714 length:735 start_codon:yes stop_codon:yes gene_type:complete